ncbi:hypothetical protein L1049_006281 [Liquidambar formosana]|uniref:Uncharacterized protein n=1 Tax=Liquidambar formosana TaxID=63359 RepID=A0AAP0WU15_LIQFO
MRQTEDSMAPSSSSSPSSYKASPSPSPPPPPPHHSSHFTPIQEGEREVEEETPSSTSCTDKQRVTPKHYPTPLHQSAGNNNGKSSSTKKRPESKIDAAGDDRTSVSCNKCRPNAREKISVVPLDNAGINKHSSSSMASPNGIFKTIFLSLTRKSPKASDTPSTTAAREEQWKITAAELSHKLIQATRKRDEAVLEASRLKYSMAELEKKLNKLEIYCHDLKSGLEVCSNNSPYRMGQDHRRINHQMNQINIGDNDKVVEHFLVSVSEARSAVRLLSRALTMQLRHMGGKVYERLSVLPPALRN